MHILNISCILALAIRIVIHMEKVVILARVSTDKQEYQRQVNELTDYCAKVGWGVEAVFCNKVSGAKRIEERAEIMEMIAYAKENTISKLDELFADFRKKQHPHSTSLSRVLSFQTFRLILPAPLQSLHRR